MEPTRLTPSTTHAAVFAIALFLGFGFDFGSDLRFGGTAAFGTTAFAAPAPPAVTRGEPLSASQAKTVDQCVAQGPKLSGKTVKMAGTVKSVCQQKGCWFALKGKGGELVRITSMGYKFFVPTNAAGKEATVEGLFEVKTLDPATAQHYENDAVMGTGRAAKRITEPVREYTLAATAVELR